MYVVQILAQLRDGKDRPICEQPTLGEDEIAQSRTRLDDALDALIAKLATVGEIQYSQRVESHGHFWLEWQIGERCVSQLHAMRQPQLSEVRARVQQCRDRRTFNASQTVKVNFQEVRAMCCNSHDRHICQC